MVQHRNFHSNYQDWHTFENWNSIFSSIFPLVSSGLLDCIHHRWFPFRLFIDNFLMNFFLFFYQFSYLNCSHYPSIHHYSDSDWNRWYYLLSYFMTHRLTPILTLFGLSFRYSIFKRNPNQSCYFFLFYFSLCYSPIHLYFSNLLNHDATNSFQLYFGVSHSNFF